MAKKLSEDQIKWVLSLDVSEAEANYSRLRKESKQLEERNKDVKRSMMDLEKAGKKESEAYARFSKEIKDNNRKLAENKQMVQKLTNQMGVTNMTMTQLRKQAKDLQHQLDNTSEALHPEEYEKLNSKLLETKARMKELNATGKQVQESTQGLTKARGAWMVFLGNMYTKAFEMGANLLSQGKELLSQGREMAAQADGVSRAFTAMDKPGLLQNLREATKNTVNDLELMKAAVKARDFRIPLEDLGKYLQFAQLKAQQTGQSVEYMTDSIVTGLGRQSVLILDNLGLSSAQINEEIEKTGDFMKGVANIVDKQLVDAGEKYVSVADKMQQRTVMIQNIQLSLGQRMLGMTQGLESMWGKVLQWVDKFVSIPLDDKLRAEQIETNQLANALLAAGDNAAARDSIIQQMNDKYPDFLKNLDTEKMTTEELTNRLKEVNKQYSERIRLQVYNSKVLDPLKEKETDLIEEETDHYLALGKAVTSYGGLMTKTLRDAIQSGNVANLTDAQISEGLGKMTRGGISKGTVHGSIFETGIEERLKRLREIPSELAAVQQEVANKMDVINSLMSGETPADGSGAGSGKSSAGTSTSGDGKSNAQTEALKKRLDAQAAIYAEAQKKIKEAYIIGQDENLQTRAQYNEAMQNLLLEDLNARLAIIGLEPEQRAQIEQQILDIRIKALEDFRNKKKELEQLDMIDRDAANQQAMDDNETWMDNRMKQMQDGHNIEVEMIEKSLKQQVAQYQAYGAQMGNALGLVLSGQENMLAAFGNSMIDILFDVLGQIINAKIAEATAVAVAEQAKAAAIAAAQPDSVATFGATAAARTAVIGGLIMAALTAAKTALKGLLSKKSNFSTEGGGSSNATYTRVAGREEGGSINVTRAQDGKAFPNAAFSPSARGFIDRPTVIVGEGPNSREWVASNAAVSNPTVAPLLNIIDAAQTAGTIRSLDMNKYLSIPGRESGGSISGSSAPMGADPVLLDRLARALETLENEGIPSFVLLDEVERQQELRDRSKRIGGK